MTTDRLDDPDYPAYTTGQAAEALGVQQAFLRALDTAGAVSPARSEGNHRRYSRRQLAFAVRIRELFDEGHTLAAALRILSLQDDLAAERATVADLRRQLGDEPPDVDCAVVVPTASRSVGRGEHEHGEARSGLSRGRAAG